MTPYRIDVKAVRNRLRVYRNLVLHLVYGHRNAHKTSYIHHSARVSRTLVSEEYAYIGPECHIGPQVKVGRYSMLAPRVSVVGDDHPMESPSAPMQFSGRPPQTETTIGRDVWVGYGTTIRRGVTIGDGAVVGANSLILKDVPAREVWAGAPAQFLRRRFESASDDDYHAAMVAGPLLSPIFAERLA